MTEPKRPIGRPPTGRDPARQLGRVDEETWSMLRAAAEASGQSFTQWALAILKAAAKRSAAKPPTLVIGEKQRPRARRSSTLGG